MTRPLTAPGRLVAGRYRLRARIGGGGMGAVWLAHDELLGRDVAVKQVLSPSGASAGEADQQRQRALREGRIAARLSHAHAISVYDVALEAGQPWLVMEYLPSRSLAAVLTDDGMLRIDQVAQIGAQVADALAATHAAGIVHRDVKPANILIGEGGRIEGLVKITDFGISHASGDVTLTQTGQITGTPAFLAPEVAQGHPMTEASDVFSLGATLYTCLEGVPPFGMEENALAMLHKVAGGQIVPPRRAGSLAEPLLRMLAADPADRPTMAEVRDELAELAAGRDGDTTTVLLARTDVGSGDARTAAFPAGAAAAGGTADPVTPAPPPAPPPSPRPTPPRTLTVPADPAVEDRPAPAATGVPPRRRRGRGLWVAAALVAVLLGGLIAVWAVALNPDDRSGAQAGQSSSAPTTAATTPATTAAEPTTEQTQGTSAAEQTPSNTASGDRETGEGQPVDRASVKAKDVDKAVDEFFEGVPGDPEAAYEQTSPGFQANFPYDSFTDFWDDFEDVKVRDVRTEDGSTRATVDIEYIWPDDRRQTERHLLTFVAGDDGELLLDSDDSQGVID